MNEIMNSDGEKRLPSISEEQLKQLLPMLTVSERAPIIFIGKLFYRAPQPERRLSRVEQSILDKEASENEKETKDNEVEAELDAHELRIIQKDESPTQLGNLRMRIIRGIRKSLGGIWKTIEDLFRGGGEK